MTVRPLRLTLALSALLLAAGAVAGEHEDNRADNALRVMRERDAQARQASDLELARTILASE